MTLDEFLNHFNSLIGSDKAAFLGQFGKSQEEIQKFISEYEPECHDVFNTAKRPDKIVKKPSSQVDPITGEFILYDTIEPVARIAVDLQQEVTKCASGILCANKIQLTGDNAEPIRQIWDDNKLDLRTISICNIWLSETEVAELWYKDEDTGEDKVMVLANSYGDLLFPIFSDTGKMIAFIRKYSTKQIQAGRVDLVEVNYYEIYTDTEIIKGNDRLTGIFEFDAPIPHGYQKIPVIYACRNKPLWSNVQSAISRWETGISNLCDTNDYFASPTGIVKGQILNYANKGEAGKLIEIGVDADIKYLTWDQAPESIKMEWETLRAIVYNSTRTVNLSIDNLKGLFGSAPSTYAIKLLFTPAHMQAAENEEIFGEYIQRRINLIASFVGVPGDSVNPKFTYFLPRNDAEELGNIIKAVQGGILSTESAVEDSPLTVEHETEFIKIKREQDAQQQKQIELQQSKQPAVAAK